MRKLNNILRLSFFLLLAPIMGCSQTLEKAETKQKVTATISDDFVIYSDWQNSGLGFWTPVNTTTWMYTDFQWTISRSAVPDKSGYYTFKVWFASNSGMVVNPKTVNEKLIYMSTNIVNIHIYAGKLEANKEVVSNTDEIGITVTEPEACLSFKTKLAAPKIYINVGKIFAL